MKEQINSNIGPMNVSKEIHNAIRDFNIMLAEGKSASEAYGWLAEQQYRIQMHASFDISFNFLYPELMTPFGISTEDKVKWIKDFFDNPRPIPKSTYNIDEHIDECYDAMCKHYSDNPEKLAELKERLDILKQEIHNTYGNTEA